MIVIFIFCFYCCESCEIIAATTKIQFLAATRIKVEIQVNLDMPFKVRIKEWRTFASWHWETGDEKQCGICRNPFDAICGTGDCNQPGDKCPMISGKCGHKFHYHCIRKWLSVSRKSAKKKLVANK